MKGIHAACRGPTTGVPKAFNLYEEPGSRDMQRIEEIYWLRAYGCLAVFSFHLLDHLNQRLDTLATDLARIPTVLGTPIFIFISIFLFSMRYGNRIPRGFLGSRVKYVMVPYLVYGLAYSVAELLRLRAVGVDAGLWETLREYLVYAGWHGYFLIIAAQFYAFYWLYGRLHLERWLPATLWLVVGSLVDLLDPDQRLPLLLYGLALAAVGLAGSIAWNLAANHTAWGGLLFGKRLRVA